ncbi:unnamed protein product [Diamesa hyperborea]
MDTFSDNSRCSSFEALNQHDPNLSQKAKAMFTKVNSYLNFELTSNQLDYQLLEKMNLAAAKSVEEMKLVTNEIVVTNADLADKFDELDPLMGQLSEIECTVDKLETAAYRLDSFTQRLEEKINNHLLKLKMQQLPK